MLEKAKKYSLIVALVFATLACSDPDQEIFDQLAQDVVLSSEDGDVLATLAASAYTPLIGNWGGHNSLWSLHENSSDEMTITQKGADWEDGGQWIRVHRHETLPTEQSVNNGWSYVFGGIGQANLLLNQFSENVALAAELRVLRAMLYLWLLDAYGNVPIILETSTDAAPPTNSRAEVYAFVESSILDNVNALTKDQTYATINYWVAQTMLAKLYLNSEVYIGQANYAKVITAADDVINNGPYSLASNFFSNFSVNNQGSPENIFVIAYDKDNGQGFNLPQMTLHYSSQASFDLQNQPWNGYASLEDFYNKFDADDARINSFLEGPQFASNGERLEDLSFEPNDPDGAPLTFTPFITELFPNGLRQEGVRVGKWEYEIGGSANMSNDFPIYRLSDLYLMKAEAIFRMDGVTNGPALDIVNKIRDRSGADNLGSISLDKLLDERGFEFFAEGWRRSDQIRFGVFNDAWWEKPVSDASKNLFPIPSTQIEANNNLTQNPGY